MAQVTRKRIAQRTRHPPRLAIALDPRKMLQQQGQTAPRHIVLRKNDAKSRHRRAPRQITKTQQIIVPRQLKIPPKSPLTRVRSRCRATRTDCVANPRSLTFPAPICTSLLGSRRWSSINNRPPRRLQQSTRSPFNRCLELRHGPSCSDSTRLPIRSRHVGLAGTNPNIQAIPNFEPRKICDHKMRYSTLHEPWHHFG